MDKYEYKLKTEQMLELMEDGAYSKAAAAADEIDWKRVRNATMLTNVSDIYEKNKEYQKSYDVLRTAYHRAEGSRKVIYRLCTLALKTGNVDEAIDYYDEFMQIAPKDPNQHILRYQILRAQRAPVEQQIEALEEFKKAEYIEEWAYELAKLYQEAGMTAECLEECDDLILWFSEGQYVYKAMELKMQYKPLTPSQQEKYDHRYEKLSSETEEMPDLAAYTADKMEKEEAEEAKAAETEESEEIKEETEEKAQESVSAEKPAAAPVKKKIGDTMRLDEALQKLLHPEKSDTDSSDIPMGDQLDEEEPEPDITDLEEAIGEIESVADLDMVSRIAEEKAASAKRTVSGGITELIPDDEPEDEEDTLLTEEQETGLELEEAEAFLEEGEAEPEDDAQKEPQPEEDSDQIEGQMSLEDIMAGWETQASAEDEDDAEAEELLEDTGAEEFFEDESPEAEEIEDSLEAAEAEEVEEIEEIEPEDEEEPEAEELIEDAEAEDLIEDDETEEIIDIDAEDGGEDLPEEENNLTEGEVTGEDMTEKKKTEPILPPDIQRMIDEIEGVIPREDEKPERQTAKAADEPHENMGKLTEELRIDDLEDLELEDPEEFWDDAETEAEDFEEEFEEEFIEDEPKDFEDEFFDESDEDFEEELFDEPDEDFEEELLDEPDEDFEEELFEEPEDIIEDADDEDDEPVGDMIEEEPEAEDDEDIFGEDDAEEYLEEDDEEWEEGDEELEEDEALYDAVPDFEEEFRVDPKHSEEPDDREVPDDDEEEMDILSATTPLSRKETAKMIATGKTAPLPLDEISDALSMSDTGFIVHGRYDLELQSGIGTRAGLTEEQKKLFSYFVPVRGMSEQLVDVLEQDKNCTNRGGTSRTGNLLIIGNKGNGKTVLAVDVVKAIQKQRNIRQGKVAIVTGDSLNKKKIGDIFDKLHGGALIIEKAGKLNEKTVARLNKAMEKDTGELLIVLEEQRKPLDRLLSSNREFRRKFTSRLEVPIFINDELVTFGQTYAQENGYRIDEMGILALYSRIDSLQREDHAVTVAEVKEVMDEAIQHSQKASAKKLVKRVFGKNTDDADRILLSEKDFNI